MTLTEFLTARFYEDEAVARACIAEEADVFEAELFDCDWHVNVVGGKHVANLGRESWSAVPELATHIARNDPARVLAEVEAKRRVIADAVDFAEQYRVSRSKFDEGRRWAALVAVGQLATAYADHPDYDEAWRP